MRKSTLLNGQELKDLLASIMTRAQEITIISAYLTLPAVKWLNNLISSETRVNLVSRFSTNDVYSGASNLSAAQYALDNGWNVSLLENLHAKIYLIDHSIMFVGSANFTANGLKVFGQGNIEACVEVIPGSSDLAFVKSVIKESTLITRDMLNEMALYIKNINNTQPNNFSKWPESIVPKDTNVWVADFPWYNPITKSYRPKDIEHDLDLFSVETLDDINSLKENFIQSKSFIWLYSKLIKTDSKELYFGAITKELHNEIKDDPTPYRKQIKELLSNLFVYCQYCAGDIVFVDCPNHSQRIRIV